MAKNQGIVRLRGSIDGVTYTEGVHGRLSRSKSSLDKAKMDSNPKFEAIRQMQKELSMFSKFGALLRSGIKTELARVKPYRGVPRLNKALNQIKNEDTVHRRGERTVSEGLKSVKGKALLKNFDFYGKTSMGALIDREFDLDLATGNFRIEKFNPFKDVIAPKNATHLQVRAIYVGLDADKLNYSAKRSEEVYLPLHDKAEDLNLHTGVPDISTQVFYMVQVLFYEEINSFAELTATDSAALTILEVE